MAKQIENREQQLERLIRDKSPSLLTEFQDTEELIDVGLRLCIKKTISIVCDNDVSAMHRISGTRLLAQIKNNGLKEDEDEPGSNADISQGLRQKEIETLKSVVERVKK